MYEEAIPLLEKCITEDYSHERAHTLLSHCLAEKYSGETQINEDNESRMGKGKKVVRRKGKYDTKFRIMKTNTNIAIQGKRARKAKIDLILSFATEVEENVDKKFGVISSHLKSFHVLRHNIMVKTKKTNDDDGRNNDNKSNKNNKKNDKEGKNEIKLHHITHDDINVTSATIDAALTHNGNNHKPFVKHEGCYDAKMKHNKPFYHGNKTTTVEEETSILLHRYPINITTNKRWNTEEIANLEKFHIQQNKVLPNQLIQISCFESIEKDLSLCNW